LYLSVATTSRPQGGKEVTRWLRSFVWVGQRGVGSPEWIADPGCAKFASAGDPIEGEPGRESLRGGPRLELCTLDGMAHCSALRRTGKKSSSTGAVSDGRGENGTRKVDADVEAKIRAILTNKAQEYDFARGLESRGV
jgi:hypothetical protein